MLKFNHFKFAISTLVLLLFAACSEGELPEIQDDEKELTLSDPDEQTPKNGRITKPRKYVTIGYVEVNGHEIQNVGAYMRADGKPFFNIAVIFAANINKGSNGNPVLHMNSNVQSIMNRKNSTIAPLQNKNIKVVLSILGNHQGVGMANFQSRAQARNFAQQVSNVINQYGLDGIDIDDEWAKYHLGPAIKPQSFIWFLQEFKKLQPNKIVIYYHIGDITGQLTHGNTKAGWYIDYAVQAYYGNYSGPNVPGLWKGRVSPAAIWLPNASGSTAQWRAVQNAQRLKNDGYGAMNFYDIRGDVDQTSYLSAVSQQLYGQTVSRTTGLVGKP